MMKDVDPKGTSRAYAFGMWMNAPMPMVTFIKTLDVSRLVRMCRRNGLKFNMLMLWCVARTCENHDITDRMVIGTSALARYDIDGAHAARFLERLQKEISGLKV